MKLLMIDVPVVGNFENFKPLADASTEKTTKPPACRIVKNIIIRENKKSFPLIRINIQVSHCVLSCIKK